MPPNGWPGRAAEGGVAWVLLAEVFSGVVLFYLKYYLNRTIKYMIVNLGIFSDTLTILIVFMYS